MKKLTLISSLIIISLAGCTRQITYNTPPKPAYSFSNLTDDGAWCWFADPRAIYHHDKNKATYVGYVNSAGDIQITVYDHKMRKTTTATIKENLEHDDHANPAILIRPDGRLMVFYSAHAGRQMFYRTSINPEDISSWSPEKQIPTNTQGKYGYTYPNPIQLAGENNKIYLFWRGGNFKPTFATSEDGINWTQAQTLIEGTGRRPYIKLTSDSSEKIHFAFTDGHPQLEQRNNIYYACYHKGNFYKADGSKITDIKNLPMTPAQANKVYDAEIAGARAWIWDIAIDQKTRPVIVYATFPENTNHCYRYAKWDGTKWLDYEITSAGPSFPQTPPHEKETELFYSGGITIDHTNPSIVYLSKKVKRIFEIERWTTNNNGLTWTSQPITADSIKNNVRPIVARNHKSEPPFLFWMNGRYTNYRNYHTAIKTNLPARQ